MSLPHRAHVLTLTDAPARKPYDVTYKVLTPDEITVMQNKEVKKVQTLLEVPVSKTFSLWCR